MNVKDHGVAVSDFPFKTDDDGRSRASFCSSILASRFVVKRIVKQRMMELILVQIETLDYSAKSTVAGKASEGCEQVFKVIKVMIMCKLRQGHSSAKFHRGRKL